MKHKHSLARIVHLFANGQVHTPPCSSHKFHNILSILVLAVTLMVSGNVWGESTDCSFAQGETIYFRIDNNVNWTDAGAYPAAVFYYSSNSAKDTKTNGTNWDNMSGSCNIGSNNYTKMTSLGNRMYSVTIPRNDIGYIRIVRVSGGDANWTWNNQKKMCVDDAKTNNCIYCNAWDNSGTWEKYGDGRTNSCGEPIEGDYWVVSDNNNWVKYQSTCKMHSAGTKVALKLINIKGSKGLDFYILDGEGKALGLDKFSTSKSTNITSAVAGSKTGSIKLSFSSTARNITIYYDGTDIYAVADHINTHDTQLAFPGDFNGWSNSSNQLSKTDTYAHTTTVKISAASGHDSNRGKVVKSGSWDNQLGNEQIDELSSCYPKGNDWENYDNRILIKCATEMSVTPIVWKADGDTKWLTLIAIPTTKYNVTFSSDHGTAPATQQVSYDGVPTKPNDPSESGWEFKGWYTTDQYTTEYDFSVAIHAATTIYAKWEQNGCSSYSFHYGTKNQSDWTVECFDGSTYSIADFVIPNKPDYWVGWGGHWQGTSPNNYSEDATFANNLVLSQSLKTNESAGTKVGSAVGAKGTLKVDNSWGCCNKRINFDPAGYGLCYGTEGQAGWQAVALTHTSGVEYMSGDVTLTADMVNGTTSYYVGILAPGSDLGYVYMGNSETKKVNTMGTFYNGTWGSNLNTFAAGDKGKLRMWSDDFDNKNWKAHFVPYWTLRYDLNGELGTAPQGAEVFSEASQQERTIAITATVPEATHKVFDGWYTEKTGGTKLNAGGEYILNAHATIYAHWTDAPQWTVTFDSDGGSAVDPQTVWNGETATEPSPAPQKTDWSFKEWQLNGVKYDFSTPVTANITLKAIWSDVCDMTWQEQYNGAGVIANAFDPSGQSEPQKLVRCKIQIGDDGTGPYYAYDDNGTVRANTTGEYWYMEDAGKHNNSIQLYYLYNAQKKYIYIDYGTGNDKQMSTNGGWPTYRVQTSALDKTSNYYKWYQAVGNWNHYTHIISYRSGEAADPVKDSKYYSLHRRNWTQTWLWKNTNPQGAVACGGDITQGGSSYNDFRSKFVDISEVDNPNYKQATITKDSKTYYRFGANGTMTCTLTDKVLKVGDKISVYCYNTSSSNVTGELHIGGSKVADIELSAGVSTYEYIVESKGATEIVVATSSSDFCVAGVKVEREIPTAPRASNLAWDTDLSAGVTRMVDAGTFTHTATAKGAGAITYSSSNEAVATVAATGLVTPIAEGTTVIKATLEQDGCYEGKEITYNVTLTDLPKPTITFTTLPSEMPQGAVQQVVVTTTAGADFALAITAGTGATLTITEQTATQITANLAMGESATNIELTASTKRVDGVVAQHAVAQTVIVSQCIPDGSDIFSFTLSTSDAANAQPATGLVGGSVSQTALGTAGTTDNPKMVNLVKLKMNKNNPDGKWFAVDKGAGNKAEIQSEGNTELAQWYMIPVGATYSPQWKNNANYPLYYLKNKQTGNYLRRGAQEYNTGNNDWRYFITTTAASNEKSDDYKWFVDNSKNNEDRMVCRAGAGESLPLSYLLNTCNQHHNICDAVAPKPAIICGHTSDANAFTRIYDLSSNTTSAPNPDMFKSVQYNSKTYYIISSEGKITINCAIKEGDKIRIDTYDRKTNTANIEEITAQRDMSSYEYTTSNEYLCVAGITIFRPKYGEYTTPTLSWDADLSQPQLVDLNNGGTAATHVATSNVTTVATVMYSSSDNHISVNEQTGAVTIDAKTPDHTTATITATLPAVGCYDVAYTSYTILVKNVQSGSLQERIDGTDPGATLTLDWDYANNDATISKKITINAQSHKIGNLTITTAGDLTLSSAMTANDFVIEANQVGHISGQLKEAANLTLTGNAYMDLSFAAENAVTAGWYAFTVPFAVSSTNGVYNVEGTTATKLNNETQYAIMNYQGDVRAKGNYGWIKTHKVGGILQPGTLYVIAFGNTDYDKIRFVKASGTLGTNTVAIHQYTATEGKDAGWNGVGNPSLAYGNATNTGGATKAQFLDHENNAFVISDEAITAQTYIVSSAFFLQASESATMTFSAPVTPGTLKAPARVADANEEFMLELSQGAQFQDRLFLSAREEASDSYEIGHDLVKMGAVNGTAAVAQMAINGYNMSLCDAEFMLTNNQALFPLTLTAPKAGDYTLSVKRACEGQDLLVMNGSQVIWDLTQGDYTISLPQGATTTYSLLLQAGDHKMPTGNDAVKAAGEGIQKIILHNQLRILKDGKMFNAQGIQL